MSTVRGRPKSGWSYQAGNGGDIDEEARLAETTADGYSKVEGGEDAINYDLDFFSADHVPAAAVQAYQEHNMNPDFAYTGKLFSNIILDAWFSAWGLTGVRFHREWRGY